MPIASKGTSFLPCPAGQQRLICCDVVDLGIIETHYADKVKPQHKVSLRFQSEKLMPDRKPFLVQRRFTLSLAENSALRPFLEAWRGRVFTEAEAEGFELDKLIGACALVTIAHVKKPKGTFAEILSIMKLPAGMAKLTIDPTYVKVRDQTPAKAAAATGAPGEDEPPVDVYEDDIPFSWFLAWVLPAVSLLHLIRL